ncbi:Tau-tubulin kinase 1 [Aphelenchoides bicaudatus]|nr:Tau-tubulin kinase 1 [Aphelenchoides bicaudatus]
MFSQLEIGPGSVISSKRRNYVLINLLGEGGFGAVFKVRPQDGQKSEEYAMKIEKKKETRLHSKLKMEIAILKLVGKKPTYFFIVMQLVGKSLADLLEERPKKVFSIATGLGAAYQCLEAIEDLHAQGFIHRDIKPDNYAIGLGDKKRLIYLLDFGIARKILKEDDELKTPRVSANFKGTVSYAAIDSHKNKELSKKDDCESWFYMLVELISATGLPWKDLSNKTVVLDLKVKSRQKGTKEYNLLYEELKRCKRDFIEIITYIDKLQYADTPDYEFIYEILKEAANNCKVKLDSPFDWEDEPMVTQKSKSKSYAKEDSIVIAPIRR